MGSAPSPRSSTMGARSVESSALHVNSTPHRAHLTRATRNFVSCGRGSRCLRIVAALTSLKSHFISSTFHRTLLDTPFCLTSLYTFSTLAFGSSTTPSLLCPSASPSTATVQGGLCSGRLAEQSLSQVLSQRISSKSAASTPRSTYFRQRTASTQTSTISRPL